MDVKVRFSGTYATDKSILKFTNEDSTQSKLNAKEVKDNVKGFDDIIKKVKK